MVNIGRPTVRLPVLTLIWSMVDNIMMPGGVDESEYRQMEDYFGQLYSECSRWADKDPESMRGWRSTYVGEDVDFVPNPIAIGALMVSTMVAIVFTLIVLRPGFLPFLVLVFILIGTFFFVTYTYIRIRDQRVLERTEESEVLSEWPGMIRLVKFPLSETWDRITKGLTKDGVRYEPFGLTLSEQEGKPRGMVFVIRRGKLRLTVWQHGEVPGMTFIHLGPFIGIGRDRARMLANDLEEHLNQKRSIP
jgi:hypothetical protein